MRKRCLGVFHRIDGKGSNTYGGLPIEPGFAAFHSTVLRSNKSQTERPLCSWRSAPLERDTRLSRGIRRHDFDIKGLLGRWRDRLAGRRSILDSRRSHIGSVAIAA